MKKTVKLIVSGDGGVGKTSFLNRLIHDKFNNNNELTKGVEFFSKKPYRLIARLTSERLMSIILWALEFSNGNYLSTISCFISTPFSDSSL